MPCRSPWFPPVRLLPPRAPALTVRVRGPCYLPAAGQGACCSRGAVPPPAGQCTAGRGLLLLVHLPSKGGRGGGRCLRKAVRCTAGGALSVEWSVVHAVLGDARSGPRSVVLPSKGRPPCTLPAPSLTPPRAGAADVPAQLAGRGGAHLGRSVPQRPSLECAPLQVRREWRPCRTRGQRPPCLLPCSVRPCSH